MGESVEPQRRERILEAALSLFGERGYRGASIKAIAAAAGVAPGLLYHYFSDKQGLLEAIVQERSMLPELRDVLAASGDRPVAEVLARIGGRVNQFLEQRSALARLLIQESSKHPVVERAWARTVGTGLGLISSYLDSRVAAGELRPGLSPIIAQALMAPLVFSHLRGGRGELLPELIDLLLHGALVTVEGEAG